jgi:UDP-N-acetylmuramyl pentapeptide phosphotransferase/UDP-N-acetylglucosamine-1-phosphate transferase
VPVSIGATTWFNVGASMQNSPDMVVAGAAAAATIAVLFAAVKGPLRTAFLDIPDRANAMHERPVARIGGLAMWVAIVLTLVVLAPHTIVDSLFVPAALVAALIVLSALDDHMGLSSLLRLLGHAICAAIFVFYTAGSIAHGGDDLFDAPLSIARGLSLLVLITWCTNLYNFMDGADGLAGGMTLFGFGAYALAAANAPAAQEYVHTLAAICTIISGSALGFLVFNFAPAKVFMGDAGSIPLGFLAAVFGLQGVWGGLWDWWFPLLVFSPFGVDATVTLLRRTVARKRIWEAHREHHYHRLILSGWSHRRTALTYYALMFACAGSALWARLYVATPLFLWAWVIIYLLLFATVEIYLARKNKKKSEPL